MRPSVSNHPPFQPHAVAAPHTLHPPLRHTKTVPLISETDRWCSFKYTVPACDDDTTPHRPTRDSIIEVLCTAIVRSIRLAGGREKNVGDVPEARNRPGWRVDVSVGAGHAF